MVKQKYFKRIFKKKRKDVFKDIQKSKNRKYRQENINK